MMLLWPDRNDNSRHFLNAKFKDKRFRFAKLHCQAVRDTERIVAFVVMKCQPIAVYIFGELIEANLFDDHSHIQLAIEGPVPADLAESLIQGIKRISGFSVDLLFLADCQPALVRSIRQTGFRAYEIAGAG